MSKHTPEPWLVKYEFNVFNKDGDACLAACGGRSSNRGGEQLSKENTANAARIVLCVNALSGIASAAPGSVAKLVEAADKAKEQLAYMLSQQHEGSEFYAGCGSECHTRVTELLTALAAITLEGGE